MITERRFARSFPDFWKEALPLLTPSCVHVLNSGYEEYLSDDSGNRIIPVEIRSGNRDVAIVTEFAYHLAREANQQDVPIKAASLNENVLATAEKRALEVTRLYKSKGALQPATLNSEEREEGLELALRYEHFFKNHISESFSFQRPIKGSGFLRPCHADLASRRYLVEVKTVNRPLAGKDIRQLVIYLALSSDSQPYPWKYSGFFNPRRGSYHRFLTNDLIHTMSGGKPPVDVFSEIIDFTCSSDVQIDSAF